jgi:hypothetical protein
MRGLIPLLFILSGWAFTPLFDKAASSKESYGR